MATFWKPATPRYMTVMRNGQWWIYDYDMNATRAAGPYWSRDEAAAECKRLEELWVKELGS